MPDPHVWRTLGYRNAGWEPGRITIEWDATEEYCFLFGDRYVVQQAIAKDQRIAVVSRLLKTVDT